MTSFKIINTVKDGSDVSFIYYALDTTEGSSCVGHWIWECAILLPYIQEHMKEHMKKLSKPIKILLNCKKKYKLNILSDFGFQESDIEYSTNMSTNGNTWQENHVLPMDSEYIVYIPNFFYLWTTNINTIPWFNALERFRNNYINPLDSIQKTIPILYLRRSKSENYHKNFRNFTNLDEFSTMINKNNINILDIDTLSSLRPQIDIILKSKIIIMEMGSAFTINAGFIASNSHIIILNDFWNYKSSDTPFFQIFRKLMTERNNTIESFTTYSNFMDDFTIDINKFEKHIQSLQLKRDKCIICDNVKFELLNLFHNFPIMAISNDSITDVFFDFKLLICNKCKCLQLENLVDPTILYSSIYTNAICSPSWNEHHHHFGEFILNNTNDNSFLEIGANTGELYKIISKKRNIEYSILDMYKHENIHPELKFVQGNCESFDYTGYNTIILSHVFEHLYSPRIFIETIRRNKVSSVFISIPNFEESIKEENILIVNSQHTFYCDFQYISFLFSLYNYKCESSFFYNGSCKSYMIKFILDTTINPLSLPSLDTQLYKNIYINKIDKIKSIEIPKNSYIIPAGIYGQFLYYLIKQKENIIGFLDNNIQRHNNKLYGTDKLTYSPRGIDYNNSTVIVCESPYRNEIILGLQSICSTVKYILI